MFPEVVISLDAEDDFLKKRIMNLPESVVAGTHNTEDLFLKRLAEFRAINTDDQTVLNYFDELEVHPEHLDIAADTSSNMSQVIHLTYTYLCYGQISNDSFFSTTSFL